MRVRFAPSPTGPLHIGGVRTALFNYLFARQHGGDFLLRIEDTDSTRYVPGAEEYIFDALAWCGMQVDEGVREGGPHAPYRQSERKEIYRMYAEQLIANGWAYYAFDAPEMLATKRAELEAQGKVFSYGPATRAKMDNALTLNDAETRRRVREQNDWVIRFKIPANRRIVMQDIIRGQVEVDSNTLDDKVLFKCADGLPTYHLANIVDDHLMEISHVIRGEEWLPSLPLHFLLYEAFGWQDSMPEFAHLPLILKPTGNGKLSKRDGDKMGFPVFPLLWKTNEGESFRGYREDGYVPEGFLNMLALLGWNPGGENEIFPLEELVRAFSLDRVSKSGARFDPEKAKWFNREHLQRLPATLLEEYLRNALHEKGIEQDEKRVSTAVELVRERVTLLPDLWSETDYLWEPPLTYDEKAVKKHCDDPMPSRLALIRQELIELKVFTAESTGELVGTLVKAHDWPRGKVMNALRLALVGASRGIDVTRIMEFLGCDETVDRILRFESFLPSESARVGTVL